MSRNQQPKLLFLAWPFLPRNAPGCVRTWAIAKYLSRCGWDVTVVTPHESFWKRVDSSSAIDTKLQEEKITRITTGHRWRFLSTNEMKCANQKLSWLAGGIFRKFSRRLGIDPAIGWNQAAAQACSHLTSKDVDVILVTGKPFSAFRLAERLAKKINRPFVLDYRDPWTDNPHAAYPPRLATIREEARLLKKCSAVTIVSKSWGEVLDRNFRVGSKLHVITNGYDPDELQNVKPYDFGHFAIVYTGVFYRTKRSVSPVMAAFSLLKEMIDETTHPWFFHYYGLSEEHVREEAIRFGVLPRVVFHGVVPRAEALSAICGANLAVVITSIAKDSTSADKGIVTSKIFEAVGLRTRVLSIAPQGSDVETILHTKEMGQSFSGDNVAGMASFITEAMSCSSSRPIESELYQWTYISKKLDAVLREVL
ncbi:glycosyltransferase [Nitrospira sp. M1]